MVCRFDKYNVILFCRHEVGTASNLAIIRKNNHTFLRSIEYPEAVKRPST